MPLRFQRRLEGRSGSFLEHLQRRYSVFILTDPVRKIIQIRGVRHRVLEWYEAVRGLPIGEAEVTRDCHREGHSQCQKTVGLMRVSATRKKGVAELISSREINCLETLNR